MRYWGIYMGKDLAQKKPGPIGRRRGGEGHVRLEGRAADGIGHKWRPVVRQVYKVETASCRSEEEKP